MHERDVDPSLALKLNPPKIRRATAPRVWLARQFERLRDRTIGVVHAPGGFGKTTLLAEWRRELLASGTAAGWLLCDRRDEGARFISGLVATIRSATGIAKLGLGANQSARLPNGELDAMTTLLADVIDLARPIALVLDDVHELPDSTARELIPYLLHNMPANLQLVVGTRQPLRSETGELAAGADFVSIGPSDLRLRLDETIEFLRANVGAGIHVDACAHVQEITEGWPIAVQLAATGIERESSSGVGGLAGGARDIDRFLHETVLKRLPPKEADFVVACSILDAIHPDLCRAMTGIEEAAALLEHLQRTTPVLAASEGSAWFRMHPLARSAFAGQFAALPGPDRLELHWRAAQWLHEHGDAEAGARHALAAGHMATAYEWIGEHLYAYVVRGHIAEVLAWVDRLPDEVLSLEQVRRAAAWAQALSYQTASADVNLRALEQSADPAIRYEADLIRATVAVYADDIERADTTMRTWGDESPSPDPAARQIHANLVSYVLLARGESERVRYLQALAHANVPAEILPTILGDFTIGIGYLQEARPRLAEKVVRPSLERIEAIVGRRGAIACSLAPALAAAYWDQGLTEDAEATLAYRIDVIERTGIPEMITLVYTVLARAASSAGQEARALDLLSRLHSLGQDRNQRRLSIVSLAEQIRIHAARRRAESCSMLQEKLDAFFVRRQGATKGSTEAWLQLVRDIAVARVRIAARDIGTAQTALREARALARQLHRTREWLEARVLLALISDAGDPETVGSLRESLSIAEANGFVRLFADAHPDLVNVVRDYAQRQAPDDVGASPEFLVRLWPGSPPPRTRAPTKSPEKVAALALLTAKEASILSLLAQGYSNKEIARATDIGQETVKWHLKNLFGKLNAGSRRHAVDRARTLGLLQTYQ